MEKELSAAHRNGREECLFEESLAFFQVSKSRAIKIEASGPDARSLQSRLFTRIQGSSVLASLRESAQERVARLRLAHDIP